MQQHRSALDAQGVAAPGSKQSDRRKVLKSRLKDRFNPSPMTLELEAESDQYSHAATIGHLCETIPLKREMISLTPC